MLHAKAHLYSAKPSLAAATCLCFRRMVLKKYASTCLKTSAATSKMEAGTRPDRTEFAKKLSERVVLPGALTRSGCQRRAPQRSSWRGTTHRTSSPHTRRTSSWARRSSRRRSAWRSSWASSTSAPPSASSASASASSASASAPASSGPGAGPGCGDPSRPHAGPRAEPEPEPPQMLQLKRLVVL